MKRLLSNTMYTPLNTNQPRGCRYCGSRNGGWQPVEHSISHWPYILIVRASGWVCRSCRQTSFDDDTLRFFDRMAHKLQVGDISDFRSLGGDYFSVRYRPKHSQVHRELDASNESQGGRRRVLPLTKPVVFRIHAPEARRVWLVGKFNGDGFLKYAMKKLVDGYWECSLELERGHYEYHFLVDGVATTNPRAIARVPNEQGGFNSIVEVG